MQIRALRPEDSASYVALRREMLEDSPWAFSSSVGDDVGLDEAFIAARLNEPGQAIVGAFDENGRLIGAAGLKRERQIKAAHRAGVWGVYVSPRARGRGVGTAIMQRVLDVARSWEGVRGVGLAVNERSVGARRMYERLGFVAWGVEPASVIVEGREYSETYMVVFVDGREM